MNTRPKPKVKPRAGLSHSEAYEKVIAEIAENAARRFASRNKAAQGRALARRAALVAYFTWKEAGTEAEACIEARCEWMRRTAGKNAAARTVRLWASRFRGVEHVLSAHLYEFFDNKCVPHPAARRPGKAPNKRHGGTREPAPRISEK